MQWLHFPDDPFELLAKSIGPPWEDTGLDAEHQLRPVQTEAVDVAAGSAWERHEQVLCPRCPGEDNGAYPCFAVHRLTRGPDAAQLNEKLRAIADTLDDTTADAASTVGGLHSSRDLCTWPAVRSAELPALLASAVAVAVGCTTDIAVNEAWLNSLDRGGWNTLHTHPGSQLSGVYYVSDGDCCEHGIDSLAGRLALVPTAPSRLTSEQIDAHVVSLPACPPGCTPPSQEAFDYLLVEPTPGTCVVWPSFVPHFVMPAATSTAAGDGDTQRPRRVSVAFNARPAPR